MTNINNLYSDKEIAIFLNILESIVRNNDCGQAIVNEKVIQLELKVIDK